MEISSTSSSYYISSLTSSSSSTSLTDEEKETIAEIISQYDTSSLTADQYQELMDQLKEADIEMSDEVESLLEEAGIDVPDSTASSLLETIKNSQSASLLDYLGDDDDDDDSLLVSSKVSELLSQYQSGEITEDDLFNSLKSMTSDSTSSVGNFVDLEA